MSGAASLYGLEFDDRDSNVDQPRTQITLGVPDEVVILKLTSARQHRAPGGGWLRGQCSKRTRSMQFHPAGRKTPAMTGK